MFTTRRNFLKTVVAGTAGAQAGLEPKLLKATLPASFISTLPQKGERVFIGPEYWANRLQDWRISKGRIECVDKQPASPMRTLHLLTHRLGDFAESFTLSVRTGVIDAGAIAADAATGFLIGAGGSSMDYRAAALIHHQPGPGGGLFAGCHANGQTFFRDFATPQPKGENNPPIKNAPGEITLELLARPHGDNSELTLVVRDSTGSELSRNSQHFPSAKLTGNVALVSHPGTGSEAAGFWFQDWRGECAPVEARQNRTCGPLLSALYTVNDLVLKLTAQLAPIGFEESRKAELQIKIGRAWKTIQTADVNPSGWV